MTFDDYQQRAFYPPENPTLDKISEDISEPPVIERSAEVQPAKSTERDTTAVRKRSQRGFAGMDAAKQREIASKGGKAAHAKGTAHQFSPEEARAAGRKGGQASRGSRKQGSANQ